jgi:hypothetical protein
MVKAIDATVCLTAINKNILIEETKTRWTINKDRAYYVGAI